MTEPELAKKAGCIFYTPPHELQREQIDPLIRDVVFRINESGWVWTGESCQGHPDCEEEITAWGFNVDPMLRLVCRSEHLGKMMALLVKSMRFERRGMDCVQGFRCFPKARITYPSKEIENQEDWEEVLIYLQGTNVAVRNRSLSCLATFADLVQE